VDSKDSFNGTGLIRAADRGHADIAGRLIQADIKINHINNLGWTALHEAIILGNGSRRYVDTVLVLVAGGANLRLRSQRDHISPLEHATSKGHTEIAEVSAVLWRLTSNRSRSPTDGCWPRRSVATPPLQRSLCGPERTLKPATSEVVRRSCSLQRRTGSRSLGRWSTWAPIRMRSMINTTRHGWSPALPAASTWLRCCCLPAQI
jgi:hypothetical protein